MYFIWGIYFLEVKEVTFFLLHLIPTSTLLPIMWCLLIFFLHFFFKFFTFTCLILTIWHAWYWQVYMWWFLLCIYLLHVAQNLVYVVKFKPHLVKVSTFPCYTNLALFSKKKKKKKNEQTNLASFLCNVELFWVRLRKIIFFWLNLIINYFFLINAMIIFLCVYISYCHCFHKFDIIILIVNLVLMFYYFN